MLVVCSKCGSQGSSKCPWTRTIFPTRESERESNFWQGMSFCLEDAGDGWQEGTKQLKVTMLKWAEGNEEDTLRMFIKKIKSIPDDELDRYVCKHDYRHTEDCSFCSFRMEAVDAGR